MKKLMAFLMAACMCFTPAAVFAMETNNTDNANQTEEITARSVYDFFVDRATQSDNIQSDAMFDVGVNLDSFQMLNFQYKILQTTLASKGYGEYGDLEIPKFQPGYASNVQDLFTQSFGDLQLSLEVVDLPDSFSVSGMLADTQSARNSFSTGFKSSEIYQIVNGQLSIGSVFKKAQEGATMPSLSTDLAGKLEEMTGGIHSQLDTERAIDIFTAAKKSGENALNTGADLLDQAAVERWKESAANNSANLKSGSSFMEATAAYMNKTKTQQDLTDFKTLMNTPVIGSLYIDDALITEAKLEQLKEAPTFEDLLNGNY